jgi:integrase
MMTNSNLACQKNIVNFPALSIVDDNKPKYRKDGGVKRTHPNKLAGVSTEVYGFYSKEEIKMIMDVLEERISLAEHKVENHVTRSATQLRVARRNKLMFIIGMNIGIRASDLSVIKWSYFLNEDMTFKESYTIQPKKQRRTGKFVKLFFNNAVKSAVEEYLSYYPIDNLEDYVFPNESGKPMTTQSYDYILKKVAAEAGVTKNVGSHSLRKTWGFWCWHSSEDKNKALVILQACFGHSDTRTTMRYIGILDSDKKEMYNSICLGVELG